MMRTAIKLLLALFAVVATPSLAHAQQAPVGPGPTPCAYIDCTVASLNLSGTNAPANGFYKTTGNRIDVSVNTTNVMRWTTTSLSSITSGGPSLLYAAGTCTAPPVLPNGTAGTTGYSGDGTKLCGVVAGADVVDWASTGETVNGALSVGTSNPFTVSAAGAVVAQNTVTGNSFIPTSSTVPTNGMYLSAANTLAWATNSASVATLSSTGIFTASSTIISTNGGFRAGAGQSIFFNGRSSFSSTADGTLLLSNNAGTNGIIFSFPSGTATLQLGAADVDTGPVAQTIRSQGTLAGGTSNVAGANWTFIASPGKGTGAGGSFIFQTAPAGSTGTVVNAPVTALTIDSTKLATFAAGASFSGAVTLNGNNITNISNVQGNNASGPLMTGGSAMSATVPGFVGRVDTTSGLSIVSGSADLIAGGVNVIHTTSTSVTFPLGSSFNITSLTQTATAQSGTACYNISGAVTYDATLGCLASLPELKNIQGQITVSADMISKVKPYWFSWKPGTPEWKGGDHAVQPGFNAREIAALPVIGERLTAKGPDGKLRGVRYMEMTAFLQAEIITLKADNDRLRAANDNFNARLSALEHPYKRQARR